jgi:hypothetical protein
MEKAAEIRRLREAAARARRAGDLPGAVRAYRAALRLEDPPEAIELNRLGTLLHMAGRRAEAVATFRKARSVEGRKAVAARIVRGSDRGTLLIGFTGFHRMLGVAQVDFLGVSGLDQCDRLLLWDPQYRFFLGGIRGIAEGFHALTEFIRARIRELAPRKVLVVGCSGSGMSALLYGHALAADVVHAFSPAVSLDHPVVERLQPAAAAQYRELMLEVAASGVDRSLLHVPGVLEHGNGRTRYFVHYGQANREDAERAQWLAACPGVSLIGHNTSSHATAELLAGRDLLRKVFTADDAAAMPRLP